MIVDKNWFFIITKTAISRGFRFRLGDRPNQETMQNLLDTTVSKNIVDKAKESSSKDVTTLAGHVVASTNDQAITFQTVLEDRTLAVQPHQLPETIKDADTAITLTDTTYGSTYSDPILDISNITPTDRNKYRHKITSGFSVWLANILSNISIALKDNITQTNVNTANIANIIALSGDSFAGAIPIGAWVEYGGETDPSAGLMIADGRSLLRASYPDAFAVLGVKYGQGDSPGSTFAIPDFTHGQTSKGKDASIVAYNTLGKTGGNNTKLLTIYDLPAHKHPAKNDFSNGADISISSVPSLADDPSDFGSHKTRSKKIKAGLTGGAQRVPIMEGSTDDNFGIFDFISSPSSSIGDGLHKHGNTSFTGSVGYQYNPGITPQTILDLNTPFVIVNKIIRVL